MNGRDQWGLLDWLVAVLLGVGAFTLYALTLAPTVLAGDGGEFQFVPYLLGVAHPTGYPLYTLLGWVWSHLLPAGDVAYRMNLFSAFWAALAVGILYPTARALLRQASPELFPLSQRLIAVLSAALFAVAPTLWSQSVIAEVYSLHIFLVILILYLLLLWGERRHAWLLLLAAGCFGLSLTHHSTTVLLIPGILAYLWLTDRQIFLDWRLLLKALFLVLLPLVLYAYIPWRAPQTPYLRLPLTGNSELILYENTLANLIDFVLGGPFGGSVDLTVDLGARLAMAWEFLRGEVGVLGIVLALVGVARLAARRCWNLLALTGLVYVASVAFNLFYTIGDIFVLFIPSYLIVVLWIAVGVGTLAEVTHRLSGQRQAISALVVLPFFVLPVWAVSSYYTEIDQSQQTSARTRWETILAQPLPPDAILVSNDRNNIMPMWYFQYVGDGQPMRSDLLGLFPLITPEYPTLGHVLDLAMETGRDVYLIKEMPGIEIKVRVEPEGRLWHVVSPPVQGEPAYPRDIQLADAMVLVGYDRTPHSPRPGEILELNLCWEALRPLGSEYHSFVHLLDADGNIVAQSDRQPGGVYYPTTLWRPGERLRDDHLLTVPADAREGVYRLLAGMYALSEDGTLMPLGEPTVIGQVGVKASVQTDPGVISQPVEVDFGPIELLGYDVGPEDGALLITLHWRCIQAMDADYTVFVHLLDAGGEIVAQHDGQPRGSTYPTSVCDVNEVVLDEHLLPLPSDLTQGEYRLRVGLYVAESGERLQVVGDGDSVQLGPVELE